MDDCYIDSFTYTSSLRKGNSIISKMTLTLGYSMDFILLSFITRSEALYTYKSWFILPIAADGTKDNSWPFETGVPSFGFKNLQDTHTYNATLHCH